MVKYYKNIIIIFTYRSTMDANIETDESTMPRKPIGTDINFFSREKYFILISSIGGLNFNCLCLMEK